MDFQERLEKYGSFGLGLEDGLARLAPHHPRWKRAFSDEAYLILDTLRIESLRLHHIGSTSVSELAAKPVIDILGSIADFRELQLKEVVLRALGYESLGEYGIPGRRYFKLRDAVAGKTYVHLHVFEERSGEIERHLAFRDRLRASREARARYEDEKRRVIERFKGSVQEYAEEKSAFIAAREAEPWVRSRKTLVILGSAPGGRNTLSFVQEILGQEGGQGAEIIDLAGLRITPYAYSRDSMAVETLWDADDFAAVVERMVRADAIVMATPIYWYSMSGVLKDFVDRLSHLLSGEGKSRGEALYGKRLSLVATGSVRSLPLGFEAPFAATAIYFGMDYLGARYKRF